MNKKRKLPNNAAARSHLASTIEALIEKKDDYRKAVAFAQTPAGQEALREAQIKRSNDAIRAEMKIGQLVWSLGVVRNTDEMFEEGVLADLSYKIEEIEEDSVIVTYRFAILKETKAKIDQHYDSNGNVRIAGSSERIPFYMLEKKVSKDSGNTWWKVK